MIGVENVKQKTLLPIRFDWPVTTVSISVPNVKPDFCVDLVVIRGISATVG